MDLHDARVMAKTLMREHGVGTWGFEFDRAVKRFGAAHFRTQKITLSRELTSRNSEAEVRNTILHEIAHALVDPKVRHGREWKLKAIELGIEPNRCYNGETVEGVPLRYQATCPAEHCDKTYQRAKRPRSGRTYYCGRHGNRMNKLVWEDTKTGQPVELFGTSKFSKRKDPFGDIESIKKMLQEAIESGA